MTDTKLPPVNTDALEGPHGIVCQAYLNGQMHLGLKYLELNKRRSPVFSWYANLLPYGFMIIIVGNYTYEYGYVGFSASLIGTGLLMFFFLPRWLAKKVRVRALTMALASEAGWDKLWAAGGIGLRLAKDPNIGCDSPDGDWRAFAEKYLND